MRQTKREPKPNRPDTPIRVGHWAAYLDLNQRCAQEGQMRKGTYIALTTRQAIFDTFASLGGIEAMLAWAKDNPDAFYGSLLPRLLPKPEEHTSTPSWSITVQKLSSPDGVTETRALVVQDHADRRGRSPSEDDETETVDEAPHAPAPVSTWDQVERRVMKRRVQIVHRSFNRRGTRVERRGWDKYDAE